MRHQFCRSRPSGAIDLVARDDLYGQRALGIGALDVRAGHFDFERPA